MKYSEKDKDDVLTLYYNGMKSDNKDLIAILKNDGYIVTITTSSNAIITRITDKGKAFHLNGGYAGARKEEARKSRKEILVRILVAILVAILGFILGKIF